jgi:outer membrane lipoprotein-sorting protein
MRRLLLSLVICALVTPPALALAAPDPRSIMQKNEDVRKIADLVSSATLATGGGTRAAASKSFKWWRKLSSDGVHFSTLTRFTAPAEVRDEAILFVEGENDANEVLLYLPSFRKTRRVESQNQSGGFMSSDFTYADIAAPHLDDFTYQYLKEEPCPGAPGKCHVIQATPARDSVKERTKYARTVNWIRQDNSMHAQVEYYDLEGQLSKRLKVSDAKPVDTRKSRYFARRLRMENVKNGQFTELEFEAVRANGGIDDAVFSKQNFFKSE